MTEAKHRTSDVYGINRDLPLNYVERKTVDEQFVSSLTRDKHLVIYGSSKQGKTSLRKHCLKDDDYIVVHCSNKWSIGDLHAAILKRVGFEVTQSTTKSASGRNKIVASFQAGLAGLGINLNGEKEKTTSESTTKKPLELDPEDVNDVIKALDGFSKFIVLEDFHYLSIEAQKDFAVALKAFHEQSKLCFIVVGVWLEESRLTVYNGDLTGRVVGINADKWVASELQEVISAGEAMLNISFAKEFRNELVANCFDTIYIVQEACYQACMQKDIHVTQEKLTNVATGIDAKNIIDWVVNQQTGRYNSFITQFAAGFQQTSLQMYRWLLYPLLTASTADLKKGLKYRTIRDVLRKHHPEGMSLNLGNVTQALQAASALQVQKDIKPIVIDYDQTNLTLNVVDRGFLIWLDNQDRNELLELAELPVPKVAP